MFGDLERSRTVAYSAAFTGLITLGSWISVPFVPVSFTLQTLFVLLAGVVMRRRAVIPVLLFLLLGVLLAFLSQLLLELLSTTPE